MCYILPPLASNQTSMEWEVWVRVAEALLAETKAKLEASLSS